MTAIHHSAVVFAYHNVGYQCLKALLDFGVKVPLVVTHEDDTAENVWFSSVASFCEENGIPFVTPKDAKSDELALRVTEIRPTLIFSFYYRYILPTNLLQLAKFGAYNMHGSLLPKYRGRAPVNWAILHGETETGVTLHEMVAKPDAGRIVAQTSVLIHPDETAIDVFGKLTPAAEQTLREALPKLLTGTPSTLPNDISIGSYFGGRKPEDGIINWSRPAQEVYNLHRAVAPPYPGAWTVANGRKYILGRSRLSTIPHSAAGTGLTIVNGQIVGVCGDGRCICIHELLDDTGKPVTPDTLLAALSLPGLEQSPSLSSKRILILGINGFIGHHLLSGILQRTDWNVSGIDISTHRIEPILADKSLKHRLCFCKGSLQKQTQWIRAQIQRCDTIIPLAAIATPSAYVKTPLRVFETDFEVNLAIIRMVVEHKKRLVFPSTSEVYGMCRDTEFDSETSDLICGPIKKSRWIYSCSKQLLDRVIFAYGTDEGLDFTIFRPFNWIGPKLDSLDNKEPGGSRVTTQFLGNIIRGENIVLVNGGSQRRTFLHIEDGVEALLKIIHNKHGVAKGKIYNIGNPSNDVSIRELATLMLRTASTMPRFSTCSSATQIITTSSDDYYGEGYQDVLYRVPNIANTCSELDWAPKVMIQEAITRLLGDLNTEP